MTSTQRTFTLFILSIALLLSACKKETTGPTQPETPTLPDGFWQPTQGPPFGVRVGEFLFGQNGHCFVHLGNKVARSLDSGKTWVTLPYPRQFNNLVIDSNGKLYAGPNGGVYASTDEGGSWAPRGGGGDAMAVIRNEWLLTLSSQGGGPIQVNRSTDEGLSWQRLPVIGGQTLMGLLYNPYNGMVYVEFYNYKHSTLYASGDNGDSWKGLYDDYGYQSYYLFTGDSTGGLWLVDKDGYVIIGPPFEVRGQIGPYTRTIAVRDPNLVMVGGPETSGFLLSRDGGWTWKSNNSGMSDSTVTAIGLFPGGTVLVGTESGMIYRSRVPITK